MPDSVADPPAGTESVPQGPRSIIVAADRMRVIEHRRLLYSDADMSFNDAFVRQFGMHFRALRTTRPVAHYTLRNVLLDADTMVLRQDGLTIPETAYGAPPNEGRRVVADLETLIRLDDTEDFIIGVNGPFIGYFSWLTQCLPAIDWSLRQARTRPVRLVLPPLAPWQEEMLAALGYGTLPRLVPERGRHYLLPHAEYVDYLSGSTDFGVCLTKRDTAHRLLARLGPAAPGPRVLYVAMSEAYYGHIGQAHQIEDLLRRRGAHVISDREPRGIERINLFRQADVVIGPHGDGLVDVLFCKPGALLWEFMPVSLLNTSMNRLAQTAGVDYWGDLLISPSGKPRDLAFDVPAFRRRLMDMHLRLARLAPPVGTVGLPGAKGLQIEPLPINLPRKSGTVAVAKPLGELMMTFESLGDACEFGVAQRYGEVEPLGLLRFAAIDVPPEERVTHLVEALQRGFDGLGEAESIEPYEIGDPPDEFMVRESAYGLRYHTGVAPADFSADDIRQREPKRLLFLRRKLLEDLAEGSKIFVWHSRVLTRREQVQPLLDQLRKMGPATLLWLTGADDAHPPGTAEWLDRDLIRGYVIRYTIGQIDDDSINSWFDACRAAYALRFPDDASARVQEGAESS
jgi:hypothetical protein